MKREYLIEARKRKGYSIQYAASCMGVYPGAYHKMEIYGGSISMKRAIQLIEIFDMDAAYFFEQENLYLRKSGKLKPVIA